MSVIELLGKPALILDQLSPPSDVLYISSVSEIYMTSELESDKAITSIFPEKLEEIVSQLEPKSRLSYM